MADFTSALYLGLRHGAGSLRPWARLTTGRPAALADPPGAREVAGALAALAGCGAGTLAPSTLHLFWDLFGVLAAGGAPVHLDAGAYAVARWGAERAAGRGSPVSTFAHHDPDALRRSLRKARGRGAPVVAADGFCPGCGRPAPVAEYAQAVREAGGVLVLDDTQAFGVIGESPGPGAPYGRGGGGSLRRWGVHGEGVLVAASLAKGFGVPGAVLMGDAARVAELEEGSQTRMHCSPPSAAVVAAAERALRVNAEHGDALRLRLARRVALFRRRLAEGGIRPVGGSFPVQSLERAGAIGAGELHARLLRRGVRSVLLAGKVPRLAFLVTAAHRPDQIIHAADALLAAAASESRRTVPWPSYSSARCRAG
ncbi:MAG TPA: aminotransferase class I/II-fold pyridoxal phosphate-dependent enzyme [Longimicrobium sp.]|jgi:8-amino-7-oxononanoate synthase